MGIANFISKQNFVDDFCEFHQRIIVELQEIWNSSLETSFHSQEVFHFREIPSKYKNCAFCFPVYIHHHCLDCHKLYHHWLLCHKPSLMSIIRYRLHRQIAAALLLCLIFFSLCISSTNVLCHQV